MRKNWTTAETDYLRSNYREYKAMELAEALGRSLPAVRYKLHELGLVATKQLEGKEAKGDVISERMKRIYNAPTFRKTKELVGYARDSKTLITHAYPLLDSGNLEADIARSLESFERLRGART